MLAEKVRWGVLGCAKIAVQATVPGIQRSATGTVVAIASRDASKARETAAELGIPAWYGSYEALLADPTVDAVYIPLPNHLHREWTLRAAAAGKHVLCEKPAGLTAQDALEMVTACRKAGVNFAEAFMYRYHPRYDQIAATIQAGDIGPIRGIHAVFSFNNANAVDNIRHRRQLGGGALYDVGCYPVSAARLLLGQEPEAATVLAQFSPNHDGVDMMATGLLEFPGRVGLTFDCAMWASGRNTLEILGADGRIEVPHAFIGPPGYWVVTGRERRWLEVPDLNPYSLQADSFGQSLLHGEPLRFDSMDAVLNMNALDACLTSARRGERVRVASARREDAGAVH